jgi:Protein of unknown function (DUF2861)
MSACRDRLLRLVLAPCLFFWLGAVHAALPATPLEPVYHALFREQPATAWQQLLNLWPTLDSNAQRMAWQAALTALISRQCGNDLPVAVPAWLGHPTLDFIQRDIPLNRIYRLQFSGKTERRDLRVSLELSTGERLLNQVAPSYETNGEFMLESEEFSEALPPGVYQLTIRSGAETWRQSLALQGSTAPISFEHEGQEITTKLPPHAAACPAPWVEQSLMKRPDFVTVWRQRVAQLDHLQWPQRADAESLWTNVSVIRAEARGGLTVRIQHRLGGPLIKQEK